MWILGLNGLTLFVHCHPNQSCEALLMLRGTSLGEVCYQMLMCGDLIPLMNLQYY